jgi:hypothetical protein
MTKIFPHHQDRTDELSAITRSGLSDKSRQIQVDCSVYPCISLRVCEFVYLITVFARLICALFFLFWPLKNRGA